MKILFVAPRYHSNQIVNTKVLLKKHDVTFWVLYKSYSESYNVLDPIIIKPNSILKFILKVLTMLGKDKADINNYLRKFFIPNYFWVRNQLKKNKPDVIIFREHYKYNRLMNIWAKRLDIPTAIYTQVPLTDANKDFVQKLKKDYSVVITPFQYPNYNPKELMIPILSEPLNINRNYSIETIKILSVGKFVPVKHHEDLILALKDLKEYSWTLTIVGENSTRLHDQIYESVLKLIQDYQLESRVKLVTNIEYDQMKEVYLTHDLFVMPSVLDTFGFSLLEAIQNKLAVIVSNGVGASNYVSNKDLVFEKENIQELKEKILKYLLNPTEVKDDALKEYTHMNEKFTDHFLLNQIEELRKLMER